MSESKELLEATIKGLEEKLDSLNADLRSKQRELSDVNKPEMTDVMFDQITELVDDAISDVCLSSDSLEYSNSNGKLLATGNVRGESVEKGKFFADKVEYDLANKTLDFSMFGSKQVNVKIKN